MNSEELIENIFSQIDKVTGPYSKDKPIALHEPDFKDTKASEYIADCLNNGWVSSAGSWVTQFENLICKYTNAKYAVAITNGTDALRLALYVMGVRSGDEVIMSPISFIATANAVSHLGAKPYFVDIERNSLGISPTALQKELNLIGIKRGQQFSIRNRAEEYLQYYQFMYLDILQNYLKSKQLQKNGIYQ